MHQLSTDQTFDERTWLAKSIPNPIMIPFQFSRHLTCQTNRSTCLRRDRRVDDEHGRLNRHTWLSLSEVDRRCPITELKQRRSISAEKVAAEPASLVWWVRISVAGCTGIILWHGVAGVFVYVPNDSDRRHRTPGPDAGSFVPGRS